LGKRQIIRIDEDKCTGCGQCVSACAEGALQIVDGKARLVGEIYCDGLGACLGECPEGALSIEEREAAPFDEDAVAQLHARQDTEPLPCGCPGTSVRAFVSDPAPGRPVECATKSQLSHWPVQLRLVPPGAPFLRGAEILVCADCVPFAVPDFQRHLAGRAVLVGCPKLDDLDHYRDKLQATFAQARPKSITVLRMEVPCCSGLAHAVAEARQAAAPDCPLEIGVVEIHGGAVQRRGSAAVGSRDA
jgi:Pyruvate/2-oxoacid:ferredoxin oxidoreductase delta subunit